jgi:hypothetical protein
MTKKGEKNQTDSFSPIQLKTIIPATHYFPLSRISGLFFGHKKGVLSG